MSFQSVVDPIGNVLLPDFTGLRIMMMPFLLEDVAGSIPESMRQWKPAISRMLEKAPKSKGVAYLTIDEAMVKAGETHRRPGLHVDGIGPSPETIYGGWGGGGTPFIGSWGGGGNYPPPPPVAPKPVAPPKPPKFVPTPENPGYGGWGGGHWKPGVGGWGSGMSSQLTGIHGGGRQSKEEARMTGMLVAASVYGCRGWDQEVDGFPLAEGVCEHLRPQLRDESQIRMLAGQAYFCSPLAVHESVPMVRDTKRQFVRISMPSDAPWYDGYTVNPLGVLPEGPIHPARTEQMMFRP